MKRAGLLLAAALLGCTPGPRPPATPATVVAGAVCRVGPDGGPPAPGDRGIGGTGSPARVADRGIGGTGARGTGIVGVITGFASVCLAGQEVAYGPELPVEVDGRPADVGALRAGQVAAVLAEGAEPLAARVSVRHEVSGPVEKREDDGTLLVAGQRVVPGTGGSPPPAGQWVRVSGFRRVDGAVVATRFDARVPGEVLIRGTMRQEGERLFIGTAEIRPGPQQFRRAGVPVMAVGRWNGGVLEADTVEPDALLVDPSAFFGPATGGLIVEVYAEGGFASFGGLGRFGAPVRSGPALLRFERGGEGRFALAPGGAPGRGGAPGGALGGGGFGSASRGGFQPAPTPNRGFERGGFGRGGPNNGDGRGQGANGRDGSGRERGTGGNRDERGGDGWGRRGGDDGPGYGGGGGGGGGFGGGGGRPGR